MSEMTAEQRQTMEDAALDALSSWPVVPAVEILNDLTAAGFVVTHPDIRDHTNCETCGGSGEADVFDADDRRLIQQPIGVRPCPGGSVVAWTVNQ